MFRGEITGLTSVSQAHISDPIPLQLEAVKAIHNPSELNNDIIYFLQAFFNRNEGEKVALKKENSRLVHGGHAIPVFYRRENGVGVRSAWYQINKGQRVNEPGDTNEYPQYFIITKGKGWVKLGNDTIAIKSNEAYYVPPNNDHVFWTDEEEPLEMIFLAWGEGA